MMHLCPCFAAGPADLRRRSFIGAPLAISRTFGCPAVSRTLLRTLFRLNEPRHVCMSVANNAAEGMSYASSGVDIDVEGASVKALIKALGGKAKPRAEGQLGSLVDHASGFSGLIEFGDRLLAMCTDGVGSKLMLCAELNYYESVALDCMAMNVNDLICVGAEPLAFVDYIAAPRPSPEIWAALGRSLGIACERARVSLCGGETATLPEMVNEIDMSGTALGWLPRGQQLDGRSVAVGDVLIGIPSSGIHSNGLSLARKVLDASGLDIRDSVPFEINNHASTRAGGALWRHCPENADERVTLGEIFLNPTSIYVDPIVDMLKSAREDNMPCPYDAIHGIAHITGGGLSNLLRLHPEMGFDISNPLVPLPEFEWMQQVGNISDFEMHRTFNMGMGLIVVVAMSYAASVEAWLLARMPGVKLVGTVNKSGVVTHRLQSVVFENY